MTDFDIVSSIHWHDGVLSEVKTTFKGSHFNMTLLIGVYINKNIREEIEVEFSNVDDLVLRIDSTKLIDNRKSGNISNGYIKKVKNRKTYKFYLYLSDGMLSMSFKNLQLIKPLG